MNETLNSLNADFSVRFTPLIVILGIAMMIGVVGNCFVIHINRRKTKLSSSEIFIMCLSIHDFITCFVGIPAEIYGLLHSINFTSDVACKMLKGIQGVSIMTSSILLLSVTYDRYRRICKLERNMNQKTTKSICVLSMVIGILAASPIFVFYGKETVHLKNYNETGSACSISDLYRNSTPLLAYFGLIVIYFVSCIVVIIFAYSRIRSGIVTSQAALNKTRTSLDPRQMNAVRYKVQGRRSSSAVTNSEVNIFSLSTTTNTEIENRDRETISSTASTALGQSNLNNQTSLHQTLPTNESMTMKVHRRRTLHRRTRRMTLVFMYITIGFVLSFLPYLIAAILLSTTEHLEETLGEEMHVFFKFCLKSYFLSSVVNPLIYGFFGSRFRKECNRCFSKLYK